MSFESAQAAYDSATPAEMVYGPCEEHEEKSMEDCWDQHADPFGDNERNIDDLMDSIAAERGEMLRDAWRDGTNDYLD